MRFIYARNLLFVTLVIAGLTTIGSAQTPPGWETLKPAEEFTVVMPIGSTTEDAEFLYHQRTLKTHLFLSNSKTGPVLAVATMTGIKSNPALYSEAQRLNSYVDAFKSWFPSKVRAAPAIAKLTVVGDKVLNGHTGREYRVTIADLNGTAQFFVTRRRLYAIVALSTKKEEPLQEKFLSSLVIPEKSSEPQATVAAKPEPQDAPVKPAQSQSVPAKPVDPETPEGEPGKTKPPPISGGVLNGKALTLPNPEHPAVDASGTVVVQVLIDEGGAVIQATALSGPQALREAAVNAARAATFSPTRLNGESARVMGVLTYNFGH